LEHRPAREGTEEGAYDGAEDGAEGGAEGGAARDSRRIKEPLELRIIPFHLIIFLNSKMSGQTFFSASQPFHSFPSSQSRSDSSTTLEHGTLSGVQGMEEARGEANKMMHGAAT